MYVFLFRSFKKYRWFSLKKILKKGHIDNKSFVRSTRSKMHYVSLKEKMLTKFKTQSNKKYR